MKNDANTAFDGYGIRDKPLGLHWRPDFQELTEVVPLPWTGRANRRRVMASVLFDAAMEAKGLRRSISYSRRRQWWAKVRRYLGSTYGYASVLDAVDALVKSGYLIDHCIAPAVRGGSGRQSTFRPAPSLAQIALPAVPYIVGELMRLKDENKRLVGYSDTDWTRRERRFLQMINEAIGCLRIDLDAPGIVRDDLVILCGDHVLYPAMTTLYRVFNNGSWKLGGRFYGGWWQQVRSADRKRLQIDGEPVVEHDYSQLHPRLIYALAEKRLDGDAYTLPGWDRSDAKPAFNILVNALTYQGALGAIAANLNGDRHRAAALIDDLRDRHAAIAKHFHTGVGLKLQNRDAKMARDIMACLLRQGISTLPVHDSFIVKRRHEEALLEAMEAAEHDAGLNKNSAAISVICPQNVPHMEGVALVAAAGSLTGAASVVVSASVPSAACSLSLFSDLPVSARPAPARSENRAPVPVGRRQLDLFPTRVPPLADAALATWAGRGGRLPGSVAAVAAAIRRERGHSLLVVASVIGLSRPQTSNIINGRSGTTPRYAARLAAYIRDDDLAA